MSSAVGLPKPGQVFWYRGPRRFLFVPTVAVGQVLGFEPGRDIVHLSTLREDGEAALSVDVGHIPYSLSEFLSSGIELGDIKVRPDNWPVLIQRWRGRHSEGEVGVFTLSIWEVERRAWEAARTDIPDAKPTDYYMEYAYPKRSESGEWDVVEVMCSRRRSPTRASPLIHLA